MPRKSLSAQCFVATDRLAGWAIHTLERRTGLVSLGVTYWGGSDVGRTDNRAQGGTIARP
jgi:hypothetical protein